MKNKLITIGLILLLAFLPVATVFAVDTATAIITANVGETTANTGIRVTASTTALTTDALFDTRFLASNTTVTLANPLSDFSTTAVSGSFAVLVKRQGPNGLTVDVSASSLTNGTVAVPYTLTSGTLVNLSVPITAGPTTGSYSIASSPTIVRDQKIFTYNIPVAASAPLGAYSTTVSFYLTVL